MLKFTVALFVFAIAGSASAAGWRSLRADGSDEASFTKSVAALQDKLSPARLYVLNRALQDLWTQGAASAEAPAVHMACTVARPMTGTSKRMS